jgi:NAD(P)-dependent dehydrogenase (short-subunit alcohol dehydrogenase family)
MARVALVTGGTRGIGKAIVQRLKEDGMAVAAGYSGNAEAAEATARELGVMVVKGMSARSTTAPAPSPMWRPSWAHRRPDQQRRHHPGRLFSQDEP